MKKHRSLVEIRREQIRERVDAGESGRVADLSRAFDVSPITIRRDIETLARAGVVRRVHGGAVRVTPGIPTSVRPQGGRIGMLIPSFDYFWPEVMRAAQEHAERAGFTVVMRDSPYDHPQDREQLGRLVDDAKVDALLLAPTLGPTDEGGELFDWLLSAGVPAVLVERPLSVGPFVGALDSVMTNHMHGAALAVRHLADLGHQRLAFLYAIGSPTWPRISEGLTHSRTMLGVTDYFEHPIPRDPRSAAGTRAIDEAVGEALSRGTTAILAHSDNEAICTVEALERRAAAVPADVSVMTYDDEVAAMYALPLTAVRAPRSTIGRAAVDLAVARLADPDRPIHSVAVTPTLAIRRSTAAAR